nr:hypothetical protein [Amylibacter sp.]
MKKTLLIPSLIATFLGTAVAAQTFSCALKDNRNSGWLPDRLVFELVEGQATARTYDPITFASKGEMATAKVQTDNSVRVALRWKTDPYRNDRARQGRDLSANGALPIEYSATLLRGGNMIMLRAYPSGVNDPFSARGACKVSDGPLEQLIGP